MSERDIIQRADWIISTEEDPDPYFIQIAASRNRNELFTALNSIDLPEDILQVRVILAMMYSQFPGDKITAKKALKILGNFADRKEFTPYEANEILSLVKEGKYLHNRLIRNARVRLDERIKEFLRMYREFNSYYCENWGDINSKLVEEFLVKG